MLMFTPAGGRLQDGKFGFIIGGVFAVFFFGEGFNA